MDLEFLWTGLDTEFLRIAFVALAVGAGYLAASRGAFSRMPTAGIGAALLVLAAALVMAASLPWTFRVGLAALVLGLVVGAIMADQQHHAARRGLQDVARSAVVSVVLVVLVLLAALPAEIRGVLQRLQGLEAGGVKLVLGPAGGSFLAQSIRGSGRSGDIMATLSTDLSQRGFSSARLDKLASLTFPPEQQNSPEMLRTDPMAALLQPWAAGAGQPVGTYQVRQIFRDRAYVAALLWAEAGLQPPPRFGAPLHADMQRSIAIQLNRMGSTQEQVLLSLGIHVECVRGYVARTHDTKVIQFEAMQVVHAIAAFALVWSSLEFSLHGTAAAGEVPLRQIDALLRNARDMFDLIDKFHENTRISLDRAFPGADSAVPACAASAAGVKELVMLRMAGVAGTGAGPLPELDADQKRALLEELRAGFVSPYLAVFAAYSLSAVGSHRTALDLLLFWLDRRTDVEQRLLSEGVTPIAGGGVTESRARLAALQWHRLQVASEAAVLASLAEQSGEHARVPAVAIGTLIEAHLVPMLGRLGDKPELSEWRTSNRARRCATAEYRWRQPFVASYLSWVHQFLSTRNASFATPAEVQPRDILMAEMLMDIDSDCFQDLDPKLEDRRLIHAERTIAGIAVRMNLLADRKRLGSSDRARLIDELDRALRTTLYDLTAGRASAAAGCARATTGLRNERDLACALTGSGPQDSLTVQNVRSLMAFLDDMRTLSP